MNNILRNDIVLLLVRLTIGALFIFSGIEKISNPESFAVSILNYKLLPEILINFVSIPLPWIELFTGLLILLGIETENVSFLVFVMLSVFTLAVIIALFRGLNIDCGCFGTLMADKVGIRKISENILFIFLSLVLVFKGAGKYTIISLENSGK